MIQFRECKWSYTFPYRSNEGVFTFCLGRHILDMCLMSPYGSCGLSATLYYMTINFNNPHGNYAHVTEFHWNEEKLKCNLVPKFVRVWKLDFHRWGWGGGGGSLMIFQNMGLKRMLRDLRRRGKNEDEENYKTDLLISNLDRILIW